MIKTLECWKNEMLGKICQSILPFFHSSIYLLFLVLLFYSCENKKPAKETAAYFDLKSYFEKQASELNASNIKLKKFVLKEELSEEKIFDHPDWKEELKPFSECDINKPSWKNSYRVDSTADLSTLCISYYAKDSTLKIKSMNVCFEHDSLTVIQIEKRADNLYYNYDTKLSYFPMKAYSIKSSQKITFTQGTAIEIKALFIP
jgi:hypothetical protein